MRGWLVVAVLLTCSSLALAASPPHVKGGEVSVTATPDVWTIPVEHQALQLGETTATVTAIDASGGEQSTTVKANVVQHRRHHCGMGAMALLFAAMFLSPVFSILAGVGLWVRAVYRRRKLAREGIEVSPLVAEAMVQAIIGRILFVIAISTVLCLALYFSDSAIAAFLVAYVPFTRLFHLAAARRFLGRLESGVPAKLHDNLLVVTDYIVVPRSVIASVQSQAVPATRISETRT